MLIGFFDIRKSEVEYLKSYLQSHQLLFFKDPVNNDDIPHDIEILSTHVNFKVSGDLLNTLPNLQLIVTRSTGFDHIDLDAASLKNITVCNVPSYGEETIAEYSFALIISLTRKIYQSVRQVKEQKILNPDNIQGTDLSGKTLGVIGTGRIGQNLIKMAQGFNMEIIAFDLCHNNYLASVLNFKYVSLNELLSKSDIISLHVPSTSSTFHMINKNNISYIKKGAILINTSRGSVIETESLIYALDQGIIQAAGLDVLELESLDSNNLDLNENQKNIINMNHNLLERNNVIITPHSAYNTIEAVERILKTTVDNIQSYTSGNPINVIKYV